MTTFNLMIPPSISLFLWLSTCLFLWTPSFGNLISWSLENGPHEWLLEIARFWFRFWIMMGEAVLLSSTSWSLYYQATHPYYTFKSLEHDLSLWNLWVFSQITLLYWLLTTAYWIYFYNKFGYCKRWILKTKQSLLRTLLFPL